MVAANPFKPKEKIDVSDLDLNKIIEEEKTHNHESNDVSIDTSLPGAAELEKTTEAIKEDDITKKEKSPFIKEEVEEKKLVIEPKPKSERVSEIEPKQDFEPKTNPESKEDVDIHSKQVEFSKLPMPSLDKFGNSRYTRKRPTSSNLSMTGEQQDNISEFSSGLPELESTEDVDKDSIIVGATSQFASIKKWLWKYRWLFIALILIIAVLLVCSMLDKDMKQVQMDITTSGLRITYDKNSNGERIPSELPIRVLAYNADSGTTKELLYYVDTIATANTDGTMKIIWDIPSDTIASRGTYNEFCILDEAKTNADIDDYCGGNGAPVNSVSSTISSSNTIEKFNQVSCTYYVPPHTTGLISFLQGWNKLDESQKIGCMANSDKAWGTSSYIDVNNKASQVKDTDEKDTGINNISTTEYFLTNQNYYVSEGADHIVYQFLSDDNNVQYRRWASGYQEIYARKSVSMRAGVGAIGSGSDWWQYNDANFNSVWTSVDKKGVFDFANLGIPDFKAYSEMPIAQCGLSNSDLKLVILDKVTIDSATCWAGDSGNGGDKVITYNLSATGFYDTNI